MEDIFKTLSDAFNPGNNPDEKKDLLNTLSNVKEALKKISYLLVTAEIYVDQILEQHNFQSPTKENDNGE